MIEAALFASTFVTVFALGLQSQNVVGGHYVAAFVTSFVIGGASLVLYRYLPDPTPTQVFAYLCGGATGIVSSMWIHRRTIGRHSTRERLGAPRPPPKCAPRPQPRPTDIH